MRQILFLCTCVLLNTTLSNAQSSGYFGKKNFIDLNLGGVVELASLFFNSNAPVVYFEPTNSLRPSDRRLQFRSHLSFGYSRLLKKNNMIGIAYRRSSFTFRTRFLSASYEEVGSSQIDEYSFNATSARATAQSISFVYTFATKSSLLPIGINHVIAVGPRFVNMILDGDYYADAPLNPTVTTGSGTNVVRPIAPAPSSFKNSFTGVELSYSSILRYPISRFLIFNFGLELRLALVGNNREQRSEMRNKFNGYSDFGIADGFYNQNHTEEINSAELRNFYNLFIGVTIPL